MERQLAVYLPGKNAEAASKLTDIQQEEELQVHDLVLDLPASFFL